MTLIDTSSHEAISSSLRHIQAAYLTLLCLFGLAIPITFVLHLKDISFQNRILEGLLQYAVYLGIFFGLERKKAWVIPLILLNSAFSSFLFFLRFLTPATDVKLLFGKAITALFCLFFAYQMIFFSKKEVRAIFSAGNKILFS